MKIWSKKLCLAVGVFISSTSSILLYAQAPIIRDGTIGADASLQPTLNFNTYEITENMGEQLGSNLLHSFTEFNIEAGTGVNFTGNASIANVINRVTGGNVSNINGFLSSNIEGVNFYLLNPNGVIFGQGNNVNIDGTFNISTANSLVFSNGALFSVDAPIDNALLSVASPTAFGLVGAGAGDIVLNNSVFGFLNEGVDPLTGVTLTANNIEINNNSQILGKTINVQATNQLIVQNSGIHGFGGRVDLAADSITISGSNISIPDSSNLAITAEDTVVIADNSEIRTDSFFEVIDLDEASLALATRALDDPTNTNNITINASSIEVRDTSSIFVTPNAAGNGRIRFNADRCIFSPNSVISAPLIQNFGAKAGAATDDVRINEEQSLGEPMALPDYFADSSLLLANHCSTNLSSVSTSQREGVAVSPESMLATINPLASPSVTKQNSFNLNDEYERALQRVELYATNNDNALHTQALLVLGQVQKALGLYAESVVSLSNALSLSQQQQKQQQTLSIMLSLGEALIVAGRGHVAEEILHKTLAVVESTPQFNIKADVLNTLGNYYVVQGDIKTALTTYQQAIGEAESAQQILPQVKAYASAARAVQQYDQQQSDNFLMKAGESVVILDSNQEKMRVLIHLAKTHEQRLARYSFNSDEFNQSLALAYAYLKEAETIGESINDPYLLSYAVGNLGSLYRINQRTEEGLLLTQQAINLAEKVQAAELMYRWYWQRGQLLWQQGDAGGAIDAYRRALVLLESSQQETVARYDASAEHFEQLIEPVYLDLVDALIQTARKVEKNSAQVYLTNAINTVEQAKAASDAALSPVSSQQLLFEARDVVERLKVAELKNYYRNECDVNLAARQENIDDISTTAGVVYPIILKDRIELLTNVADASDPQQRYLQSYPVDVDKQQLEDYVHSYRQHLEGFVAKPTIMAESQQLYTWLMQPYINTLQQMDIDTLVFVPGGVLRTIPMASLHDGSHYLIQQYAIATTTSLTLTDPKVFPQSNQLLLAGVSEAKNDFPALDSVPGELFSLKTLYGGDVLLNDKFTVQRFSERVERNHYSMIHVASHAQFTGKSSSSFLLAYDQAINMSSLDRVLGVTKYRDSNKALELLVLSACKTASGNDRAGLGLAGVGIKAGARSAMGSLWNISDESTAELIELFYTQLKTGKVSKAEALRQAQLSLLEQGAFAHPSHWSAFLLIDNWL